MTGGRVVVLGDTGINFAAGMSGGLAYVYDPENHFDGRCNLEMVDLENISDARDATELRQIIARHREETSSRLADRILSNWENEISHFVKVFPMEYRRVLGLMSREDEEVERQEDWTR
jgi:glutamate synthase domain-containing protein 3